MPAESVSAESRLRGLDLRPGATWDTEGTHFVLRAPGAEAVVVELYGAAESGRPSRRAELARVGTDRWHTRLDDVRPGQLYGYRVHGPHRPQEGHRWNAAKLLVDPYARAVTGEPKPDPSLYGFDPDRGRESFGGSDSAAACPKCVVVNDAFDWQGDKPPRTPWRDTVIYECHVRGMTFRHPEVEAEHRGRFLGMASPPILEHLKRLGVTAVELLPVAQIATEPGLAARGLVNYWGYSPLAFMAPHAGYASGRHGEQVRELKQMVRALHRSGIEVILDMVFNHTAEGGADGPTLSWRGIANAAYYRLESRNRRRYLDLTGCGNTFDLSSELARELVVGSLRYWVEIMHVDGFRFDLATTLGRGEEVKGFDFSASSPLFEAMASDPVLAEVKCIAEPWDLGHGGYRLGGFPTGWAEWNDRFRDDVRRAWLTRDRDAAGLASRLAGSEELLPRTRSVNYVACHDGMTLADAVSYSHKHNLANGEGNRDGSGHEICANHGTEGPTDDLAEQAARVRAKCNLLACTLLARGVPMLGHGDELGRSQHGNNNAYCLDNETGWLDWTTVDTGLIEFVARLVALRRRMHVKTDVSSFTWFLPDGAPVESPEAITGGAFAAAAGGVLVLINLDAGPKRFSLPTGSWSVAIETKPMAAGGRGCRAADPLTVAGESLVCLEE